MNRADRIKECATLLISLADDLNKTKDHEQLNEIEMQFNLIMDELNNELNEIYEVV